MTRKLYELFEPEKPCRSVHTRNSVGVLSFKAQSGGFVVSTYRIRPHYFVDTNNEDLPRTRDPLTDPDARPWSRSVHARGFPYPSQRQDCMRHAHITHL